MVVVVLLALDFWTVRNVSGRVLVGLRFWNQVDEDGTSFWVFEHRNVSNQTRFLSTSARASSPALVELELGSFRWALLLVREIVADNLISAHLRRAA